MKFLSRFFITLLVLVFAGNGQLDAHSYAASTNTTLYKTLENIGKVRCDVTVNNETNFMRSSRYFEPDNSKLRATDNEGEEEELNHTSKKSLQLNGYHIAAFFNSVLASFYHDDKKNTPATDNLFHFTSYKRYIAFRVIRI
ncbi:hypothetical protein [Flavobacterium suzhouense]|uniref:Uncharacterized protein n=1 Tax=Flavobacterium suzhouense TaxID=1529638 RepID=A0ABW5NVM1_9FLAO